MVRPDRFAYQIHHLPAGKSPLQVGGHHAHKLHLFRIIGLNPVGQRATDVHERIADGGHFPVENTDNLHGIMGSEDDIIEFKIIMDKRGSIRIQWYFIRQPGL